MLDLLIRGGKVVTPQGVGNYSIGVQGERIVFVGMEDQAPPAGRTIDAEGKIVVPGGIEPHAHLDIYDLTNPDYGKSTLGPEEDTRGMAFGGTTTHLDFCFIEPGMNPVDAIEQRVARWKGQSYVDYSFHVGLMGALPLSVFDQIDDIIKQGFPSFKVFTTDVMPPHPQRVRLRLDLGRIQLAMVKVARSGGIMVVHAEDDDLVQFNYERFAAEGRTEGSNMHLVHTKLSEELAFDRVIRLARSTGAGVYFVHTSAKEGVEAVAEARGRNLPVYCETLHHYACFSHEDYKQPRGFCYHTYPSLKGPEDNKALWQGLIDDAVSTTATDEFPTTLDHKLAGKRIDNVTGGNLGAEARMGIFYTEGVVRRGMTLERFADVTSTNAARILGLYPRKGAIAPGSDADIVLIDPSIKKKLTKEDFHVSDYSPWEGWHVEGWPVTTVLRGKVIVETGKLSANLGYGQLVPRKVDPVVLRRPAS
jgi:dihydroorotase-like cyclic amidohydrolase